MNPDTNELIRFEYKEELEKFFGKGFIQVPQHLERAAELTLGKNKSIFVSKTSGGKLSKWAAKKRKEMVDNCNNYYSQIKREG